MRIRRRTFQHSTLISSLGSRSRIRSAILKGFVADGRAGGEGSTNWSTSGEGTFVVAGEPGGIGYKAQNNTQSIFTDQDTLTRFQAELIAEHMTARKLAAQSPQKAVVNK